MENHEEGPGPIPIRVDLLGSARLTAELVEQTLWRTAPERIAAFKRLGDFLRRGVVRL